MPNQPKTTSRNVRVPDERWEAAGRAADVLGQNRSEIINTLLAWFTREKGAKLPKRPELEPASADGEPVAEQQPAE